MVKYFETSLFQVDKRPLFVACETLQGGVYSAPTLLVVQRCCRGW